MTRKCNCGDCEKDIPINILDDMASVRFTVGVTPVDDEDRVYDVLVLPRTTTAQKEAFGATMKERYDFDIERIDGEWIRLSAPEWVEIGL